MKRHFPLLAAAVATLFTVGGSLFAQDAPETKADSPETPVLSKDADFAERQLAFTLNAFQRTLETESATANTLVAPYSAYRVLGALSLGTAGQTKTEIDAALFRSDLDDDAWKKAVAVADSALDKTSEVAIAGFVWSATDTPLKEEFIDNVKIFKNQSASERDFKDPNICKRTNAWFARATKGRIPNLLNSLSPETRLLIADATTFDGQWKNPFDAKDTKNRDFTNLDGETTKFPLMSKTEKFAFYEADGFQYLEAPYDGDRFSLIVVLPNDAESYVEVERALTPAKLLDCRKNAKPTLVEFRLPKFTVERSYDLTQTLQKLGVVAAFGLNADLTPMTGSTDLQVDRATQGAYLAIDEVGTQAAAATAVTVIPKATVKKFYADRPFFYMIRSNDADVVLFAGRFVSPDQAEATETGDVVEDAEEEAEKTPEKADEKQPEKADEPVEETAVEETAVEETADAEAADAETADAETADEETADEEAADEEAAVEETADAEAADAEAADEEAADEEAADEKPAADKKTQPKTNSGTIR